MSTIVIAEAGVNHNGDLKLALKLVDEAAAAGADYVKFQTFQAEKLASAAAPAAPYQQKSLQGGTQLEMLKNLELSRQDHHQLMARCRSREIGFLSSAFDLESLDFLSGLGLDLIKIPSGELTNRPYLERAARLGLPVLLSTGMADLSEVEEALRVLTENGLTRDEITVLHCSTEYPVAAEDVNLRAMATIRDHLGVEVGYSDHTLGIEVAIAAVALGAVVIEKHFTLDRQMAGPDHSASLEPGELAAMVRSIRNVERALGDGLKRPTSLERRHIKVARKSVHLARDLSSGHALSPEDLIMLRPGDGISPMKVGELAGRKLKRDCEAGHKLEEEDLE